MISRRNLPYLVLASGLVLSSVLISCSKESKINDLKSGSIKIDSSGLSVGSDTDKAFNSKNIPVKKNVKDVKDTANDKVLKKEKVKIIVYYFHPTARCPSCINIENFTNEVVNKVFINEKKNGLLSFVEKNIEDSANEHYIGDYNLQFSSVILAKFVNNKQVKWKNLEDVWKFANIKEASLIYLKTEIKKFIKE
jgi:hypothetical protein